MTMVIRERSTGAEVVLDGVSRTMDRRPRAWTAHPITADAVITDHRQDGRRDRYVQAVISTQPNEIRDGGHDAVAEVVEALLALGDVCDVAIAGEPVIEGVGIGDVSIDRSATDEGKRTISIVLAAIDRVTIAESGAAVVAPTATGDRATPRPATTTPIDDPQAYTILGGAFGV